MNETTSAINNVFSRTIEVPLGGDVTFVVAAVVEVGAENHSVFVCQFFFMVIQVQKHQSVS